MNPYGNCGLGKSILAGTDVRNGEPTLSSLQVATGPVPSNDPLTNQINNPATHPVPLPTSVHVGPIDKAGLPGQDLLPAQVRAPMTHPTGNLVSPRNSFNQASLANLMNHDGLITAGVKNGQQHCNDECLSQDPYRSRCDHPHDIGQLQDIWQHQPIRGLSLNAQQHVYNEQLTANPHQVKYWTGNNPHSNNQHQISNDQVWNADFKHNRVENRAVAMSRLDVIGSTSPNASLNPNASVANASGSNLPTKEQLGLEKASSIGGTNQQGDVRCVANRSHERNHFHQFRNERAPPSAGIGANLPHHAAQRNISNTQTTFLPTASISNGVRSKFTSGDASKVPIYNMDPRLPRQQGNGAQLTPHPTNVLGMPLNVSERYLPQISAQPMDLRVTEQHNNGTRTTPYHTSVVGNITPSTFASGHLLQGSALTMDPRASNQPSNETLTTPYLFAVEDDRIPSKIEPVILPQDRTPPMAQASAAAAGGPADLLYTERTKRKTQGCLPEERLASQSQEKAKVPPNCNIELERGFLVPGIQLCGAAAASRLNLTNINSTNSQDNGIAQCSSGSSGVHQRTEVHSVPVTSSTTQDDRIAERRLPVPTSVSLTPRLKARLLRFQTDYSKYRIELQEDFWKMAQPPNPDIEKRRFVGCAIALIGMDVNRPRHVYVELIDIVDGFLSDFLAKKLRLKMNLEAKHLEYQEKQTLQSTGSCAQENANPGKQGEVKEAKKAQLPLNRGVASKEANTPVGKKAAPKKAQSHMRAKASQDRNGSYKGQTDQAYNSQKSPLTSKKKQRKRKNAPSEIDDPKQGSQKSRQREGDNENDRNECHPKPQKKSQRETDMRAPFGGGSTTDAAKDMKSRETFSVLCHQDSDGEVSNMATIHQHTSLEDLLAQLRFMLNNSMHSTICNVSIKESKRGQNLGRLDKVILHLEPRSTPPREGNRSKTKKMEEYSLIELFSIECSEARKKYASVTIEWDNDINRSTFRAILGGKDGQFPIIELHVAGRRTGEKEMPKYERPAEGWIGVLERITCVALACVEEGKNVKDVARNWMGEKN